MNRSLLPRLALLLVAFAAPLHAAPTPIRLQVDVSDTQRRLFRVEETIPVQAGPLSLLYPEWLPGNHAPRGPIEALAGLRIEADGQALPWTRDPLDMYRFRLQVPEGVVELKVRFDYATPMLREQGRIVATPEMIGLQWNAVLLYPEGAARALPVEPSVRLPTGWQQASALQALDREGDLVRFAGVDLETLIDSPLFAGRHFRQFTLDAGAQPVRLNVLADAPYQLDAKPEQLAAHARLVREADALFRSRHFERYDFLFALSDAFSGIGLEHHRSSENALAPNYFSDWDKAAAGRSLLPHEYVHSWNGKFRRPADQAVVNHNTPLQNSLLWVYEGQTTYWGNVLAARSGLWSADFAREALAQIVATQALARPGRLWRPLIDTTNQPILTPRRPLSWLGWQRTEDYYTEGALIWLDVDTRLRELSREKKSLDDFAASFFGVEDGRVEALPYTFDDVAAALNRVAPYDWASFLKEKLQRTGEDAPLDGLARSGWKLSFGPEPTAFVKSNEDRNKNKDFSWSLGVVVGKDGALEDVLWGSPAFAAGLSKGDTLLAVNGRGYSADFLRQALIDAQKNAQPIELIVKNLDRWRTLRIDYRDGPRYPRLERLAGTPDRLSTILKPRAN
ncbi:MAG: M61 family peptidase [Nevskiaceae bacterium]|nr:MAG: M61 family peptidase [Nevskiaceae bacterium]TAM22771.1 MAG: M61 family peptidase [Nevskiaceae bacterium]